MGVRDWIDIPPAWLLGALLLTRALAAVPDGIPPAPALRLAGQAVALAGLALMLAALVQLLRYRTTPVPHHAPARLVTVFPYSLSRNPIYLGDAAVLTGAALWWASLWGVLLVLPAFVFLVARRFIPREEARLAELAPDAWRHYAARVRRWL